MPTNPPSSPPTDACREAFERYMRDETGRDRDLSREPNGIGYLYMNVEDEWRAWEAGAAWSAAQSKGEHDDDGK